MMDNHQHTNQLTIAQTRVADYATEPSESPSGLSRRIPRVGWRLVIALLVSLSLIFTTIAILNSPLLEVRNINIHGAKNVSSEAVAQLAGLSGTNILLTDLGEARKKILDQPLIKDASISRHWPNSVNIEIIERVPWARWEANEKIWAIDRDGVVLEGLEAPENSVIVHQTSTLPAPRGGVRLDLDAVTLIDLLQQAGAPRNGPEILNFYWSLSDGITIVTKHGHIIFGDSNGFAFKYAVWEQLEFEAQRRGEPLLSADLRFGTRPAVDIGLGLGRATRIVEH